MAIIQAIARTPRRLRLVFDSLPGGATTAANYAFVRADNSYTSITASSVWTVDSTSVEIALSEALLPSTTYTVTISSVSAAFSYEAPVAQAIIIEETSDPEDEAFGVDIDLFADALDPVGDLPTLRGMTALRNDLISVVRIIPGEIAHRPDVGAGLDLRINGANVGAQLADIRGAIKREWLKDDRVDDASIKATANTTGLVELEASVKTVSIDESMKVVVNG